MKIEVERNGKIVKVNARVAEVLMRKGIVREAYQTRDMADQPMFIKTMQTQDSVPIEDPAETAETSDGLDDLDRDQLHELAKERGIQVHHRAGADTVRAALRGAAQ